MNKGVETYTLDFLRWVSEKINDAKNRASSLEELFGHAGCSTYIKSLLTVTSDPIHSQDIFLHTTHLLFLTFYVHDLFFSKLPSKFLVLC